jgi:hypothetical protein
VGVGCGKFLELSCRVFSLTIPSESELSVMSVDQGAPSYVVRYDTASAKANGFGR